MEVSMKKLLSLILAISTTFGVPIKAAPYDSKTIAGCTLITAGFSTACLAAKLWTNYTQEKNKLRKELQNAGMHFNDTDAWERQKKNFLRMSSSFAIGVVSFSAITSGLVMLAYRLNEK